MAFVNPYRCEDCRGTGKMICCCCDQETECDVCAGTGLNDDVLDVTAFLEASDQLQQEEKCSWDWIENGEIKGRRNKARTLAFAQFKREAK